jgi:ABC-type phosphate transport system substrate-binding protein
VRCASGSGQAKKAVAESPEANPADLGFVDRPLTGGEAAEAYSREHPETEFWFDPDTNSDGAIKGVLESNLDLAVANRPLSEDDAKEPLEYHAFAQDAVVFVAHRAEKLEGLFTQEVRTSMARN